LLVFLVFWVYTLTPVIGAGISYAWFRPGALPQTLESVVSLGTLVFDFCYLCIRSGGVETPY
jgi:hypothetical protein